MNSVIGVHFKALAITPLWTYKIPSDCIFDGIDVRDEWITLTLYCKEEIRTVVIELTSGKATAKGGKPLELRGTIEKKTDFTILRCFYGYGNRIWSRIMRGLKIGMICRKEVCVTGFLRPNYNLEISVVNSKGTVLESLNVGNTLDFSIGATNNLIVVSTISPYPEYSAVLFIDPATGSIVDEYTGFGGIVIASPSLIVVHGEHENKRITRVYNDDGEEVISDEGTAVFVPFNPYPFQLPGIEAYGEEYIVVIDKYNLKVYNTIDYNLEYILVKPPYTKAVFNLNPEEDVITVLSRVSGFPLIVSYNLKGEPLWYTHIVRNVSRVLHSNSIVTLFDEGYRKETRVGVIRQPLVIEEDRFGPGIEPLHVWGRNIVLFDGSKITAYTYEEKSVAT